VTTVILLAIDDSEFSRAATQALVQHLSPESTLVHVLHVMELDRMLPPAYDYARGTTYGPDVAAHLHSGRHHAERIVGDASRHLQDAHFRTTPVVREGDPKRTILDYAATINCDCIVMGSHGWHGVDRFFMGSVSEGVVRHAHCSVLVVRRRDVTNHAPPP
jgi:nucleotide-binding universal stress UspA family protein